MSHDHTGHTPGSHLPPGDEGAQESPVAAILDTIGGDPQTELLEMLHVPLLHGGVREVLLLASFTTNSAGSFALACFLLALATALLETLRLLLWWVESQYTTDGVSPQRSVSCDCKHCTSLTLSFSGAGDRKYYNAIHDTRSSNESTTTLTTSPSPISPTVRHLFWGCVGFLQFLIYIVSTLLMLIAMTMNIYIILSMAVGAAIGKMITICVRKHLLATSK